MFSRCTLLVGQRTRLTKPSANQATRSMPCHCYPQDMFILAPHVPYSTCSTREKSHRHRLLGHSAVDWPLCPGYLISVQNHTRSRKGYHILSAFKMYPTSAHIFGYVSWLCISPNIISQTKFFSPTRIYNFHFTPNYKPLSLRPCFCKIFLC